MNKKFRLKNLQFFADDTDTNTDSHGQQEEQQQGLSQDQVNDIIAKRLAKEKSKWQKDYDKRLEEEKAEAQRLANMDAEQRKQAELEKRIAELEEREQAIKLQEVKMETVSVLKTRGLPESFVDFVIGSDNEKTLDNINRIEKAFNEAVKAGVDAKLTSHTPPADKKDGISGEMTKEQFKALPLSKQNELYVSDPEKYKQLF